ncbi:cytochrome P450 81Q32-like [Lactuca sativa]|uniref:Cytochrome P450 n=1 Tax=Lactuca sativa TaxID=4236 RepID=A0A9R1XVE1_LACSA|nr:cytochrome P450 81Q32-like [Lactuca sativa]KAJ0227331.1 hypothetical protein LSAT_V11C100009770 [Lactuca sativa]
MEVLYLYVSFLLLLASYLFTSIFRRKISNFPPTVFPSLPVIGHLYLLKPPLYRTLAKISDKYGPIFRLQLGFRPVVVISSPSLVEECFTKNDVILANRPRMLFGKIIGVNYTSLAWAPYGDNWRNLRRIASIEILSIHRLNEFHDIRADEARSLIRKLASGSSPVTMKNFFYELTLNVMMRMIAGKRYFGGDNPVLKQEGIRFREMLHETFILAGASNVGDYLPILSWFGVKGLEKRLIALQEKRDVFFQGIIDELRKSKGSDQTRNKRKTMIEVLLSLQESDPEYYTDALIRSFVLVLLAAGSDSSAGTMEWTMSLLLNHPEVLKKAQNEIDQVVGKDRFVDESDISNLPYLRCIMNETLRLKPPGPLVPHEASEDCVIGGFNIPGGTMVLVNQWAIHHDPMVWADPETYNPERFEGVEGTRDGFKLLPFGYGRRSCPGEGLAVRVLGMTLGTMIQCFDWERISEEMVDMSEAPGLTMPKAAPLVAKCKPRLQMENLLSEL